MLANPIMGVTFSLYPAVDAHFIHIKRKNSRNACHAVARTNWKFRKVAKMMEDSHQSDDGVFKLYDVGFCSHTTFIFYKRK